jgi:dUTP pyrophosphatase
MANGTIEVKVKLNMECQTVKVKKLNPSATIPMRATNGAAGADLTCTEDVFIAPCETKVIKTGLSVAIPANTLLAICARSGLALKTPYLVKNGIGILDEDYRGELGVIVHNLSHNHEIRFKAGDRIAQAIVLPYIPAIYEEVDSLEDTERGTGGFGSTGA